MSDHFKAAEETRSMTRLDLLRKILLWRPTSIDERMWAKHAYFRVAVGLSFGCYWAYWHPEYSIISAWWHGTNEPIVHRAHPVEPSVKQIQDTIGRWFGIKNQNLAPFESEPTDGVIRQEGGNAVKDVEKQTVRKT